MIYYEAVCIENGDGLHKKTGQMEAEVSIRSISMSGLKVAIKCSKQNI